jgi:transcriptional regulator with XRE-family HTH domain
MDSLALMPPEEVERLVSELRDWCGAKYGRQVEVAVALGVTKQQISNWLSGRRTPSTKYYFAIRDFLEKQRK